MLEIEKFNVLVEAMGYVFRTVPWTIIPYTGSDHKLQGKNAGAIEYLNDLFIKKEIGGWCGLNCEFFKRIILEKKFPCRSFNYGIEGSLTHITILVKVGGVVYLFDPYFNRYYEIDGEPLPYNELIDLVNNNKTDIIKSVYGEGVKPVEQDGGGWEYLTGEELESGVIDGHMSKGLGQKMLELFGDDNPFNLMKIEIN